jgi:hypothetical protein
MRYWALAYRFVRCLAFAAVAILLLLIGAIQVQQWVFHHRAARLLRDIQSIRLRQTTFRDAQVLFNRWKDYGKYRGKCTENYCEFQISMETFVETRDFNFFGRQWLENYYVYLGARPAQVFARIGVLNGIVWDKSFILGADNVMGESGSVSRFPHRWPDYTWHPEYLIGTPGGCCVKLYAKFTPYTDPRVVQRLMDINLSCVLPWSRCREGKDIMPGAWNQRDEDSAAHPPVWHEPDCNEQTVRYLARDAQSAAIIEVLAIRAKKGDYDRDILFTTVRLLTPLKRIEGWLGPPGWPANDKLEIMITDKSVALTKTNPLAEFRPGRRFILLLTGAGGEEPCGAVPLTPHNLELVRWGIGRDYLVPYPELEIYNFAF